MGPEKEEQFFSSKTPPEQENAESGDIYDDIEKKLKELKSYSNAGAEEKADQLEKAVEDEDPEQLLKTIQYYIDKQEEHKNKGEKRFTVPPRTGEKFFLEKENMTEEEKSRTEKKMRQIAEEAINKKWEKMGEGYTAKVFTSSVDCECCFKIITDPAEYEKGNNVAEEMEFLDALNNLDAEVKVPQPFYYYMSEETHLYVMEKLKAIGLDEIIAGTRELPANFNIDPFFKKLENFIHKMNQKQIYHRDLHEGNIMTDEATGDPRIIDFGHSKKNVPHEEAFRDKDVRGEKIFPPDEEKLQQTKNKFIKYIGNKK